MDAHCFDEDIVLIGAEHQRRSYYSMKGILCTYLISDVSPDWIEGMWGPGRSEIDA